TTKVKCSGLSFAISNRLPPTSGTARAGTGCRGMRGVMSVIILLPFVFLMFSPSGSVFPLRPAVRGKKLFTDGNRLIFQWRGKRIVPPIQKTESCNDANDLHDLLLIPVLT